MSAFNGSGTFVISGAGLPVVTATTISSTVQNQLNTDLATGLSTCITKDGQTTPTANIPMGGFKLTGVGVAASTNDALSYGNAATITTLACTTINASGAVATTSASGFVNNALAQTISVTVGGIASTNAIQVISGGSAGVQLANGASAWAAISDERLKTALTSFGDSLTKVASLRAGTGRYLTDTTDKSRAFLIAQDVATILPEAIDIAADGIMSLRYTDLIPLLVAALTEAKTRIEALEQKCARS